MLLFSLLWLITGFIFGFLILIQIKKDSSFSEPYRVNGDDLVILFFINPLGGPANIIIYIVFLLNNGNFNFFNEKTISFFNKILAKIYPDPKKGRK